MSEVDVRDLANEQLPPTAFPADSRADFRLHIAPEVRRGIEQHAKADPSVEICGVLVGNWGIDEDGPFATVTDYIRCENATSKFAEVTFTHESWSQINNEMDSKYADKRIVGWYHSHPNFGIFLSDRDCFIHEHFFSGPGQVAYVIDPVRDEEGVFAWRGGKPTPLSHFWVGNKINGGGGAPRNEAVAGHSAMPQQVSQPQEGSSLFGTTSAGFATTALALLTVFLIGYLYGNWRTDWEQRMAMAVAVVHFADTNLIREGLEDDAAGVQSRLSAMSRELEKLPEPDAKLSKEELDEAAKRRKFIRENLAMCEAAVTRIGQEYGLSDLEKGVVQQIAALKAAELRQQMDAVTKGARKGKAVDAASDGGKTEKKKAATEKKSEPAPAPKSIQAAPTE